jgi:hypothetical protein
MTRLRASGALAGRLRSRRVGTSATPARLSLLLAAARDVLAPRPAAGQTEVVENYGYDALGSIRIVFSASGVTTARADHEPFGDAVTLAGMPAGHCRRSSSRGRSVTGKRGRTTSERAAISRGMGASRRSTRSTPACSTPSSGTGMGMRGAARFDSWIPTDAHC